MSALAIFAALVIHTYDGQDRVITDIEPAACELSRCRILFGHKSCGEALAEGVRTAMASKKLDADQLAWERANPKTYAHCFPHSTSGSWYISGITDDGTYCGPKWGAYPYSYRVMGADNMVNSSSSSTQSVMCIRQRGDRP